MKHSKMFSITMLVRMNLVLSFSINTNYFKEFEDSPTASKKTLNLDIKSVFSTDVRASANATNSGMIYYLKFSLVVYRAIFFHSFNPKRHA